MCIRDRVVALATLGILIIGSANNDFQFKQTMGLISGVIIMVIVSLFDYTWILNFYWIIYVVAAGLLVAVLLVGVEVNGAQMCIRDRGSIRCQGCQNQS